MRLHPTGKFDNSAKPSNLIEVRPLAAAMGAEIYGVDVPSMSDEQMSEVRQALYRHKMIYFRGQTLLGGATPPSIRWPRPCDRGSTPSPNFWYPRTASRRSSRG